MEVYPFKGFQAVDITSGALPGDLEELFVVTGAINPTLPSEHKIKLELYPFLPHKKLDAFKSLTRRLGISLPLIGMLPEGVTEDKLAILTEQYQTEIIRFHLPFFVNPQEFRDQMRHGDYFKVVKRNRAIETVISLMIGTVVNNHGIRLAQRFGAGVNAHPNDLVGLKRLSKLNDLKKASLLFWRRTVSIVIFSHLMITTVTPYMI